MCAFSGGPDSSALIALAGRAGCIVEAVHVDHGLRPESADEAQRAVAIAEHLGIECRIVEVALTDGPNLEARARAGRMAVLGSEALTGHTLDDQAETALLALLRGSGAAGLAAMRPSHTKPILALRRTETESLCVELGIDPVVDPSNDQGRFRRNRIRHDLLPLAAEIAERDPAPLIARTADLLRVDDDFLEMLAADIDVTDAQALSSAPAPLARRAVRRWLALDGYPPDAHAVARVLAVAGGEAIACEVSGGRRVERSGQRLRLVVV